MKTKLSLLILLCLGPGLSVAQFPNHPHPQYPEQWNAQWITHPEIDQAAYGMIHFRNVFQMKSKADTFLVHVSGDNRYRLYVNGRKVCYGPQLGDIRHWRYETIDLAPYLQKGDNVIAAQVMNWGVERSYGIISFKTAFLLQGHTEKEQIINTSVDNDWKVLKNRGMVEKPVNWMSGSEIVGGFYAANPTDSVVAKQYPWGWKNLDCNDHEWQPPEFVFSRPKTNAESGHGWILQPRTTKIQSSRKEPLTRIARTTLNNLSPDFQFTINDKVYNGFSQWKLIAKEKIQTQNDGKGCKFRIVEKTKSPLFELELNYLVYEGLPLVRK